MFIDVKDSKFKRDVNSLALINNDMSAKEEYLTRVRMLTTQKEEINNIKSEVMSIKNDVNDIKNLLTQLLGKGGNG